MRSWTREVSPVAAPAIIPSYNENMNGVDHADQLQTEYCTYRSSRKWWLYLFSCLLCVALTNWWRSHQTIGTEQRTMTEFRMNLAKLLIGNYTDNKRAALAKVNIGHFPQKEDKIGRCRQCSKNGVCWEILNMCGQCHLCIDYFQPWHRHSEAIHVTYVSSVKWHSSWCVYSRRLSVKMSQCLSGLPQCKYSI